MGLSYGDFLQMTPAELTAYSTGYQKRINRESWLTGLYVHEAISCIASAMFAKKGSRVSPYPNSPHRELQPATEEEKQAEIEAERLRAYAYFDSIVQACKQEQLQARLYMQQMVYAGRNWGSN